MPGGGMDQSFRRIVTLLLFLAAPSLGAATRLSFEDLLANLKSPNAKTRQEAAEALGKSRRRERASAVGRFLDLFSDEFDRSSIAPHAVVDPSVIQGLTRALRDEDKDIREEAALALGILNGTAALRELTAALQDPEPGVRGAAATAIGKIGSLQDGRALIPLLSDNAASVRHRALQAIGVLKVTEAG